MNDNESRQSFLGRDSDRKLAEAKIAIVGLGGGGSHIAQQLAHIGIGNFVLFDADSIEDTNLNRLVGGTAHAVVDGHRKVDIAERLIRSVQPRSVIEKYDTEWQRNAESLRDCDLIFGCVDSFRGRAELERVARRYLIPYLDIGMDVVALGLSEFLVSGQVVLSLPNGPCLWCLGILDEESMVNEAQAYGAAGPRQQVIWPNGVLASTAVGLGIQMLTPWAVRRPTILLEYDGNKGTLVEGARSKFVPSLCTHHLKSDLGDPFWSLAVAPAPPKSTLTKPHRLSLFEVLKAWLGLATKGSVRPGLEGL